MPILKVTRAGYPRKQSLDGLSLSLAILVLLVVVTSGQPHAHAKDTPSEYQVKAAFLYQFAKFVTWPPETFQDKNHENPFVIGVLGEDPFEGMLEQTICGKRVKGRALEIRRAERLRELETCHILFISRSERRLLPQILKDLGTASILTISDIDQFARAGGIICLTVVQNKVRFRINVGKAEKARLKISSKLLRLAEVIPKT